MATQKEVADRAGVSFITVSRVVNKLGNVKPETRQRVEEAIRELRYHPNRQAQALNNGLTRTLALVTPRMFDLLLANNYYVMSLLSGVELRGRELGWDVLITTDFDRDGQFDFLRVWHQRKVDGLIFVGLSRFPPEQIREIEEEGIPSITLSDRIASPAISWIDTDNASAAAEAVHRLADLGHRHLAYLGADQALDYNPNFRDRELGVRRAAKERGLELDVFLASSIEAAGDETTRAYLAGRRRATGVIAENDGLALAFVDVTRLNGLDCPRDFSIVGFDAEPAGRRLNPTLASFAQPLVEMGQTAVQHLVDRMTGRLTARAETEFPLVFVPGDSLAPPP